MHDIRTRVAELRAHDEFGDAMTVVDHFRLALAYRHTIIDDSDTDLWR